ncbi:MAG: hypothetical protein HON51_00590 [Gammaproteobacteria bacterium]|jgi:hypothetical protein|nr:hypothetical protein [Gammaproteobacteria bacterium]MBT5223363.1 hypothetical protein [Gammaproteobacteria bacterium]MBT6419374.1 hypothetical protein [Gammaproteobacteria bacterium]MBT6574737.1 hypothetical protein [Gammaproteobacteria bacterium]
MINISITDPQLETLIHQSFGDNQQLIEQEFSRFIQESRIKKDIKDAVEQIDAGDTVSMKDAFESVRRKYE